MGIVRSHRSPCRMRNENNGFWDADSALAHVQRVISRGIVLARNTGQFGNRALFFVSSFLTLFVITLEAGGGEKRPISSQNHLQNLFVGAEAHEKQFFDLFRDSAKFLLKWLMGQGQEILIVQILECVEERSWN